jgi:hypothetical protein
MTISYETPGKHYAQVSLPVSEWYVGTEIPGAIEWGHTTNSIHKAVDFYYNHGFMINLYSHEVSNDYTLIGEFVRYCSTQKPRMWSANAVEIADWWYVRSPAVVTPSYSVIDDTIIAQATVTGTTDPDTAIEVVVPNGNASNLQVLINDVAADPADYRTVGNVVRVRVGASPSTVKVQYTINNPVPATMGLIPGAANAGDADFMLTVNGSGFVAGSVAQWNEVERTTMYVSSTQLTVAIPAADIAVAGTAEVTVFNPEPGGGTSNAQTFTINNPIPTTTTSSVAPTTTTSVSTTTTEQPTTTTTSVLPTTSSTSSTTTSSSGGGHGGGGASTTSSTTSPATTSIITTTTTTIPLSAECVSVAPSAVDAGVTVDVTVTLQNIDLTKVSGVNVTFGCTGITVNSVTVTSANRITVNITAAENAPQCTGNVTVTNGTGTTNIICENVLTVNAKPPCTLTVNPGTFRNGVILPRISIFTISGTKSNWGSTSAVKIQGITTLIPLSRSKSEIWLLALVPSKMRLPAGNKAVTVTTGNEICTGNLVIE